ncbi:MAG: hypothetical protein JWR69_4234 [Pedosphaera sp.]|nr:hypothetical protein [Pedosphaera sp.]
MSADPFLARKAREVLEKDSSIALDIALGRLSSCASIDFIKETTSDYRRWWIGSFLKHAETAPGVSPQDYAMVFAMFTRLLGGYACGGEIIGSNVKPTHGDFTIIPENSEGMTVWTASEVECLTNLIHSLFSGGVPHFHGIQGHIGIAPRNGCRMGRVGSQDAEATFGDRKDRIREAQGGRLHRLSKKGKGRLRPLTSSLWPATFSWLGARFISCGDKQFVR